jgi:hypothetical protein
LVHAAPQEECTIPIGQRGRLLPLVNLETPSCLVEQTLFRGELKLNSRKVKRKEISFLRRNNAKMGPSGRQKNLAGILVTSEPYLEKE